MKPSSSHPDLSATSRCAFTKSHGHRCRMPAAPGSEFCAAHQPLTGSPADLLADLSELRSTADVTVFLSRLIVAVSRNQLSVRDAKALTYLSTSLLRALQVVQKDNASGANGNRFDPLPLTWNLPRCDRPTFENADIARAFYAQKYADEMWEVAEQSAQRSAYDKETLLAVRPPHRS